MDRARATAATGTMHVEERDSISLAQNRSVDAADWTTDLIQRAGRNMSRNDRVWHARQTAVPQMHIRAAHFGTRRAQQCCSRWQLWTGELLDDDGLPRRGHHRSQNGIAHVRTLTLIRPHHHR